MQPRFLPSHWPRKFCGTVEDMKTLRTGFQTRRLSPVSKAGRSTFNVRMYPDGYVHTMSPHSTGKSRDLGRWSPGQGAIAFPKPCPKMDNRYLEVQSVSFDGTARCTRLPAPPDRDRSSPRLSGTGKPPRDFSMSVRHPGGRIHQQLHGRATRMRSEEGIAVGG